MTWKIEKAAVLLFGEARAILMQLAHPMVAVGSHMHSYLMRNPFLGAKCTLQLGQIYAPLVQTPGYTSPRVP